MTGCAVVALFTALPREAAAQSFNGTPEVVAGNAGITTGPGTTTVNVFLPETVINWYSFADVDPSAIDFQPGGTTATFNGPRGGSNYTVLNRILPLNGNSFPTDATVAFNGTVNSFLGDGATPGGNIWFYSPTGIIVGPKAAFNVGSLILTTDDIQFVPGVPDVSDGSIYGPGGVVQFRGTPGSKGFVDIQPGAQITASGNSAYVALVAPRVQQGGAVSANGPIGYIGAEQIDMTINAGLFDISILAGTTDPNGVVHTGTTTGPASTSYYDQQQIMLVAMPKSTALTMLLSGSIGYTPAVNAYDDGSSIVLSAGYGTPVPTAEAADSLGHISIDGAGFSNPVSAYSTGSIDITGASGPVSFGSNAYLFAQDSIDITLGTDEQMDAFGYLSLNAGRTGKGGTIDISVEPNASLTAGNYIDLSASSASTPYYGATVGNVTGGAITVDIDGGTFSSNGIYANAYASGGYDFLLGGTATGGDISFTARNGGRISAGYLSANADAYGGSSNEVGGDAIGGSISLTSRDGMLDLSSVYLEAQAYAGDGGEGSSGMALGGKASLLLDGGVYDWNGLSLTTDAYASGGDGGLGNGAMGLSDAIDVSLLNGAALSLPGELFLSANAFGTFDAPVGAFVRGGGIKLSVAGGSSLVFGSLSATARADLDPPSYYFGEGPSTTPDTFGGTISLTADGGSISGHSVELFGDAYQFGALNDAGSARGGSVAVSLLNGSSLVLDGGEGSVTLNLGASGYGALGDSAADAIGGTATLTIFDSSVDVTGVINVAALGLANTDAIVTPSGSNPVGFNATGGTAAVSLHSSGAGTASLTAGDLIVDARGDASTPEFYFDGGEGGNYESGYYGGPFQADGGVGTGGTATLNLGGGVFTVDSALVTADGSGGLSAASYSGTPFRSGDGRGGNAVVAMTAGTNTIDDLTISAAGYGGDGSSTGDIGTLPALAGDGFGGNASLTLSGGTLQADGLALDASGFGGTGGDGPDDSSDTAATDGGAGTGGTARLVSTAGSTGQLTLPSLTVTANGIGGSGGFAALGSNGNGGDGIGGTAAAQLADGAFSLGPVIIDADGIGGDGVVGGEGSGGSAQFNLIDTTGPSGARDLDALSLYASGVGGLGSSGTVAASDAGSVGLDIEVANAAAALVVDGDFEALSRGSRAAAGSGFNGKVTGALFRVNGDATIDTARDATMAATSTMFVTGAFASQSRSFTETGLLSAYDSIAITAPQGISAEQLRTDGGTTTLLAASGPIALAYLTSFGDVTAQARSIHISNGGRLNVASAQATAGDLFIHSSGTLTLQSASATGAMDFAGSSVTANSALASGGNFAASGTNGVSLISLDSGGSTTLTSTNGIVSASGDVNSAGVFAASGGAGVSFGNLDSGGTTSLTSGNGAVSVTNLTSAGLVTAVGGSVTLQGSGPLAFANAQATAGNLSIVSPGSLSFGQASATGTIGITSSAGAVLASGPISAGGAVNLLGATGLNLAALTSGAATGLSAANGAIAVSDLHSAGAVTASGRSIDLGSSGALSFADAKATAGNLRVIASGNLAFAKASATGSIAMTSSAGSLSATGPLSAGGAVNLFGATGLALGSLTSGGTTLINGGTGALTVASLTSPGAVTALGRSLDITSPGALTFSSIAANGGAARIATSGNLAIGDGTITGALTLASANGAINSTGTITAGGAVSLNGKTGLDFNRLNSGATTSLVSASGPIRITRLASAGLVTANGGSINIGSAEGLSFATVDSPGGVSITAAGDLLFNTVSAGADLALNSTGGSLTATGAVTGGYTQLASANGITIGGDLTAGALLGIDTRGAFVANGSTYTDDASIVADGGITMASLRSGEITRLTASDGNILVGNLDTSGRVSATGLEVDISSTGSLTFDEARATSDDLRIRTGGDLNAYTLFANQDIDLAAGGTFALSGVARGFNITVTSADIDIGDEAQLGVRDSTSEIALFNGRPAQETFIGGAHQSEAYSLDADEITRLFADDGISLGVAGSEIASDEGHLTVGDLALTFGTGAANIGSGGFLEISTPTEMSIVGDVALTTASADDRFIIDPARVELNTDTGSIAMLGADSNPLGRLEVTGDTIAVGTGATLDQLANLSDFAAINALLDKPGGKADPLRAGTMAFNVGDGLFIQNSGASTAADDRRGFAANGLDITTASSGTRISINGVILQDGTSVTGLDTAPLVRINGLVPAAGGQYDSLSTINGCAIGIDCSPLPPPPPETGPDYTPPPNDELEPPVTPGNPGEGTLSGTLIELQSNEPLISPPLVDEPITGVGNDDLWVPECKSGPQQEGCPKQGEDQ